VDLSLEGKTGKKRGEGEGWGGGGGEIKCEVFRKRGSDVGLPLRRCLHLRKKNTYSMK